MYLQDRVPNQNSIDYLADVLYNAFYCFEALLRNLDDVVCGLCSTVGMVYFGGGNAKTAAVSLGLEQCYSFNVNFVILSCTKMNIKDQRNI